MAHWRSLVESKYLSHYDLNGRSTVVTIASVAKSEVIGKGGVKNKKAVVRFVGKEKGMVMGVTCLAAIASIYGDDTDTWIGKPIEIYPTTTEASGATVGTIRVRPTAPRAAANSRSATPAREQPRPTREPGDDAPAEDRGDEPTPEEMGR